MRPYDMQAETPPQWMEHSDAWRYDHLDLAPSELLRRDAIAAHDRLERARMATLHADDESTLWQVWLRLPLLTRQMVLLAFVVMVVALGAFLA
jgi:hypothetical protein